MNIIIFTIRINKKLIALKTKNEEIISVLIFSFYSHNVAIEIIDKCHVYELLKKHFVLTVQANWIRRKTSCRKTIVVLHAS